MMFMHLLRLLGSATHFDGFSSPKFCKSFKLFVADICYIVNMSKN